MIKTAIDLTWVRHAIVGGTEPYVTNLLDGFASVKPEGIYFYLLVSPSNREVFSRFSACENMELVVCPVRSSSRVRRVLWQNFCMGALLKKLGVRVCIEPVYLKPFLISREIRFITVIHDLQALHYPEYFNKIRVLWMKFSWRHAVYASSKIIVTSEFVRQDILSRYRIPPEKLCINYDPVLVDKTDIAPLERLKEFGVEPNGYYYMVASLLPHKNIDTAIKALALLKENMSPALAPLLISGVGGKSKSGLLNLAKQHGVEDIVRMTPYISVSERNLLYQNCKAYLFPSLFEGFGLTPIEAMILGAPVIATKESCTYETTGGIAVYVDEARNPEQWRDAIENRIQAPPYSDVEALAAKYSKESVASRFVPLIRELNND